MKCNLCGGQDFVDVKSRVKAKCSGCGSLERTRLLWMYLKEQPITPDTHVLHLAPERGLYNTLKKRLSSARYEVADLDPTRYPFADGIRQIDLGNLENEPSDTYDIIIHSHVLEHIPCAVAYTLFHLSRMLKADGRQICIIPFSSGFYDETYVDLGPEERTRRFGQHDHVRRFGVEDAEAHLGKIVRLPAEYNAESRFGAKELSRAAIPKKMWRGLTISTVLELTKNDYLLR